MHSSIATLLEWMLNNMFNIIFTLIIILVYLIFRRIVIPLVEKYIERDHLKNEILKNAIFTINVFSGVITLALIFFVWGFDFKGLLALSTGLIAITGVALFANWSILSNITAFFILLAHQSYRRGNFIRVLDLDNYIEGYISEINLFNTKIITENREIIIFPNNMLIARPVMINPKSRYSVIGKTDEFANITNDFSD